MYALPSKAQLLKKLNEDGEFLLLILEWLIIIKHDIAIYGYGWNLMQCSEIIQDFKELSA